MTASTELRDLGVFRVGDKPAREVLECFEQHHRLPCNQEGDCWRYTCEECGITYRVKVEEDHP